MRRNTKMRLNTVYLLGALAVAAVPLSAVAQPVQANRQAAEQYAPTPAACPAGWVWEPAGYMGNGHWREAHFAARNTIPLVFTSGRAPPDRRRAFALPSVQVSRARHCAPTL